MKSPGTIATAVLLLLQFWICEAEHGRNSSGWKPRSEYTYDLDGRTVAGFPSLGLQQHAGIHFRGILRVQKDAPDVLLLRIQNMTYTKLHDNLTEGWWAHTDATQQFYRDLPITTSTIAVKMLGHQVHSLTIKKNLEEWEVNFIQGLVNQLQVDSRTFKTTLKSKRSHSTSYKTMENSLFGRCEILYEVTRVPRSVALAHPEMFPAADKCNSMNFIEIFKTRNFSNCEYQAEFHFGLPVSKKCCPGGSSCQNFWNRASTTRISGCGDQSDFHILQSETNSRVMAKLHLHERTDASVSSYVAVNLKSIKSSSRRFVLPADSVVLHHLKFKFKNAKSFKDMCLALSEGNTDKENKSAHSQEDKEKRKSSTSNTDSNMEMNEWKLDLLGADNPPYQPLSPYNIGIQGYEGGYSPQIQKFKYIISQVASAFHETSLDTEKLVLENILAAVKICRVMSFSDLKKALENSRNNKFQHTESMVSRDILAMCGTNPAFKILKSWIEQKELTGEDAAQVVASLPSYILTPSPDLIRQFYDLIKSSAVRNDQQLKITATLALSNLIRVACVDDKSRQARYTDETFDATCELNHTSHYVTWLKTMMQQDRTLQRVYIAALGNTGALPALTALKAIAEDVTMSAYLRASAVLAIKHLALSSPENVLQVLLSLYRDTGNPVPVRAAAVSLLFFTRPDLTVMQRIAVFTWYDPSMVMAAFVRSSLLSFAQLRDPQYAELSNNADRVLALSRPVTLGRHSSHNLVWSQASSDLEEVVMQQLQYESSIQATNLYYRFTHRLGGLSRIPFQGEVFVSNPDHLLNLIREMVHPKTDVAQARPALKDLEHSTRWIREQLRIAERKMPIFEGDIHLQTDRLTERLFPFNKELQAEISKASRRLLEQLKMGKNFHYQKVHQTSMSMAVITELGLPINFEMSVPWAFRVEGNAKLDFQNRTFDMDVNMMYASKLVSEIGFFTAWDETMHVAASHGTTLLQTPVTTLKAMINTSNTLQLLIDTVGPSKNFAVFHHSNKPFTSQHQIFDLPSVQNKSALVIHTRKSVQKISTLIPNVRMNYTTEAKNPSPMTWLKQGVNVLGFMMMWPTLEASSIDIKFDSLDAVRMDLSFGYQNILSEENSNQGLSQHESIPGDELPTILPNIKLNTAQTESWIASRLKDFTKDQSVTTTTTDMTTNTDDITTTTDTTTTTTQKPDAYIITTTDDLIHTTTQKPDSQKPHAYIITIRDDLIHDNTTFNASFMDPFSNDLNTSSFKYIFNKSLEGIKDGHAYVLSFNMSMNDNASRNFSTLWTYATGRSGKEQRFGVFLSVGEHKAFFTSMLKANVTPMFTLDQVRNADITALFNSDFIHYNVSDASSEHQLSLKAIMKRSKVETEDRLVDKCIRKRELLQSDIYPECLGAAADAMNMDNYTVFMTYNNKMNQFNATVKQYMDYFHYRLLPYITEYNNNNNYNQSEQMIKAQMVLSPSLDSIDALIQTQNNRVHFNNVPVNPSLVDALRFSPAVSYTRKFSGESYCGHTGNKFITFDGVHVDYNLTSCWHLLAKDCSGKSRVAILIRSTGNNTELKINLDNYQVLKLSPGIEASMNGEPVQFTDKTMVETADQDGTVLFRMVPGKENEKIVSVEMPAHNFHVIYTGSSTIIMTGRGTSGRLCGICGDNNGDTIMEFRKPQDTQARDAQEYASSYTLSDSDCQPVQNKKDKDN